MSDPELDVLLRDVANQPRRLTTTAALGLCLAASAFLVGLGALITWALWGWH